MKVVDLTQEIYNGMPIFPGHLKTHVWEYLSHEESVKTLEDGYSYTTRGLLLSDHGPTHVDAIKHIDPSPDALSIDKMPLETFFGPALCLDISFVMNPVVHRFKSLFNGQIFYIAIFYL